MRESPIFCFSFVCFPDTGDDALSRSPSFADAKRAALLFPLHCDAVCVARLDPFVNHETIRFFPAAIGASTRERRRGRPRAAAADNHRRLKANSAPSIAPQSPLSRDASRGAWIPSWRLWSDHPHPPRLYIFTHTAPACLAVLKRKTTTPVERESKKNKMADRPKRHTAPVDYASVKIGSGTPAWMRGEQVRRAFGQRERKRRKREAASLSFFLKKDLLFFVSRGPPWPTAPRQEDD